jgi:hypothetical protein
MGDARRHKFYLGSGKIRPYFQQRGMRPLLSCTYVLVVGGTSWSGEGVDPKSLVMIEVSANIDRGG